MSATALELQWFETWTRPGASDRELERAPSESSLSEHDTETLTRASVDSEPRWLPPPAVDTGTAGPAWPPSSSVEIWFWYQLRLSSSVSRMS